MGEGGGVTKELSVVTFTSCDYKAPLEFFYDTAITYPAGEPQLCI